MTAEKLKEVLEAHQKWLDGKEGGKKANLTGANMRWANLTGANMRWANLSGANMRWANLSGADLTEANLTRADLRWSDLTEANLTRANLTRADLTGANLTEANLTRANLSRAKGLSLASDILSDLFKVTKDGIIAYKIFGAQYSIPDDWKLESGAVITENVNHCRTNDCGCGINVATLDWLKKNYHGEIWEVLIRWEWLPDVCVPYGTTGKIRCGKCELVKVVDKT